LVIGFQDTVENVEDVFLDTVYMYCGSHSKPYVGHVNDWWYRRAVLTVIINTASLRVFYVTAHIRASAITRPTYNIIMPSTVRLYLQLKHTLCRREVDPVSTCYSPIRIAVQP